MHRFDTIASDPLTRLPARGHRYGFGRSRPRDQRPSSRPSQGVLPLLRSGYSEGWVDSPLARSSPLPFGPSVTAADPRLLEARIRSARGPRRQPHRRQNTLRKFDDSSTRFSDSLGDTSVFDPRDMTPRRLCTDRARARGERSGDPPALDGDHRPRDPRSGRLGRISRSRAACARRSGDAAPAGPRAPGHLARDGFQKLRFLTPDGLAVETVLIPLHKPGAVSVCLSSQVGCAMGCVFCATARMPSRRTWPPGRSSTSGSRRARSSRAGAAGHRGGLHGDGRAVPELRPRDRGRRTAPLSVRRPDRRQGDHDQHRRARPRDRPLHRRGAAVPAGDQPGGRDRREAGPPRSRRRRGRRWPKSWPPPAATPWPGAIASCCPTSASRAKTSARTTPGRSGELIGDTPVRLDLIDVTDPTGRFHPRPTRSGGPSATP